MSRAQYAVMGKAESVGRTPTCLSTELLNILRALACTSASIPSSTSSLPSIPVLENMAFDPHGKKSILLDIRVLSCDTEILLQKRQILSVVFTDTRWQL